MIIDENEQKPDLSEQGDNNEEFHSIEFITISSFSAENCKRTSKKQITFNGNLPHFRMKHSKN